MTDPLSAHTAPDASSMASGRIDAAIGMARTLVKRTGRRPLSFVGRLLSDASSPSEDVAVVYRGAMYETFDGGLVATLSAVSPREDWPDRHFAWSCADVGDVLHHLASHDAHADVPVVLPLATPQAAPEDLDTAVAALRDDLAAAEHAYRIMIEALIPTQTDEDGQSAPSAI